MVAVTSQLNVDNCSAETSSAKWFRESSSLYDGDNVCADFVSGAVSKQYITPHLDQNLAMKSGGSWYYYSQDGLGSVRTLTDSSGTLQNEYSYTSFGEVYGTPTEGVSNRYTYTGREKSSVSGVPMYYRYRMYDPIVGRFGRRDPIGYSGSQYANLYEYVYSSPISLTDPYGLGGVGKKVWLYDVFGNHTGSIFVSLYADWRRASKTGPRGAGKSGPPESKE